MSEQANFASSLLFLLLKYKGTWKGRLGKRSYTFAGYCSVSKR